MVSGQKKNRCVVNCAVSPILSAFSDCICIHLPSFCTGKKRDLFFPLQMGAMFVFLVYVKKNEKIN